MSERGRGDSGADGLTADEAFGCLANETRLDILRVLWAEHEPYTGNGLPFSELFARVDYADRGNFAYHLEKLVGTFVRRTDDGYELRETGHKVLRSVHAGTVTEEPAFGAELEKRCPLCDGRIEALYRDDRLYVRCTSCDGVVAREGLPPGLIFAAEVPPAVLDGRTPEEVLQAAITWNAAQYPAVTNGVCPDCTGRLGRSLDVCEAHPDGAADQCDACGSRFGVWARHVCENCGYARYVGLWPYVWQHPEVRAFLLRRGLDVVDLDWESAGVAINAIEREEVRSTDPLRVRHVIRVEGDELAVTLDGDLRVVDVEE